ncbi:hypothetical protein BDN67DRAFT_1001325 [Paxillus ammoniavirescens]|nr:hypothetical protein BDN67DRAFT_1001325 [Paxillus ammoniavirescens]
MKSPSAHRRSAMGLTQLPTELLCQILGYFDAHQLVHARKICKTIKSAIDHSESLQYTVDLGFYQMSEGRHQLGQTLPQVPVAIRRKELQRFETSWQQLQYRHRTTFPLPISGPVYEFVGGIYALTGEGCIRFAVLPDCANPPEKPIRMWDYVVDTASLIDFTFSPSLDLFVLVTTTASNHQHAYDVHLRSLSTNKPHPCAAVPILKAFSKGDAPTDFYQGVGPVKLQIMGEYLALLCRDTVVIEDDIGDYLQMWTWTTENGYGFVLNFEESINDFIFLSSDRFLLLGDDGTLVIYSFADKAFPPMCTASLGMPRLMRDWQFAHAFLGGNPAPRMVGMSAVGFPWTAGAASDGGPEDSHSQPIPTSTVPTFHPNSDDQLLAFHVTVFRSTNEADTHSFVCFVLRSTILRMEGVYQEQFGGPLAALWSGLIAGHDVAANHIHSVLNGSAQIHAPSTSTSTLELASRNSSTPSSPNSSSTSSTTSDVFSNFTTDTEPPSPPTLPWALWGPYTHWFPDGLHVDWQNSVYGFRTVESLNEDNILGGYFSKRPRRLRVRDFNPNLAFHYHQENLSGWCGRFVPGRSVKGKGAGRGERVEGADTGGCASTSKEEESWGWTIRPFVEPLGKGLSYREVVSRETFDVTEAMMDESRILLLRRRAENGELEKVEVLVM